MEKFRKRIHVPSLQCKCFVWRDETSKILPYVDNYKDYKTRQLHHSTAPHQSVKNFFFPYSNFGKAANLIRGQITVHCYTMENNTIFV